MKNLLLRFIVFGMLTVLLMPVSAQRFPVEIWEIQGASHRSPLVDLEVVTQNNIVTAISARSFYIQTPAHLFPNRDDGNEATSNGILVFTNSISAVRPGDMVNVSGTVTEFRSGDADDHNLSITEITAPQVSIVSHGHPLPPPLIIGTGGRVPPDRVINDDSNGDVESEGTFDHTADGIDFWESIEGMRVGINNAIVTGATNGFGEVWVVGDGGSTASWLTPRGGIVLTPGDFNPERIQLDNELYPITWESLNVGARYTNTVTGVVSYSFGNYEVLVTERVTFDEGDLEREITSLVGTGSELTIGTYNVENLEGRANDATFDTRAVQIVEHLRSPDILVLQEIQDNDGTRNTTVVDATTTLDKLVAAVERAGGPAYEFALVNPVDDQDGGVPGGNIRTVFFYNPARVTFTPQTASGDVSQTPVQFQCNQGRAVPDKNPGRIDPANTAFEDSRKPLFGALEFGDETLFLIGTHLNSKGGDNPLFGQAQPPVFASETQRHSQAAVINSFVGGILACQPEANIVVLGDMNDFWFSETMHLLAGDALFNLDELLSVEERYSYVFDGNAQVLDQILVSAPLLSIAEVDVVHINAEFFEQVTDHDPTVAIFRFE